MTDFRPTQIFASFKANPPPKKVAVKPEVDVEPKLRKDHTIEVTATGELSLLPDRCKVFVRISSSKDNVQEAKNSVTRRLDYVIQTLSNNQVKDSDVTVTKLITRPDNKLYQMDAEVSILFVDFQKYQTTSNILVEKLDETVRISSPQLFHSQQKLEALRRQACLTAVNNAKTKAIEMARFLNQTIGPALSVKEEHCHEWEGSIDGAHDTDQTQTFQQRLQHATITVNTKVSATFSLKSKVKGKKNS